MTRPVLAMAMLAVGFLAGGLSFLGVEVIAAYRPPVTECGHKDKVRWCVLAEGQR